MANPPIDDGASSVPDGQAVLYLADEQHPDRVLVYKRVEPSTSADQLKITNGLKGASTNGALPLSLLPAPFPPSTKEPQVQDDEPAEDVKPGMKTGLHNLYSGKEDKKGRYQWQDKIPDDLGDPAENDKTAKWALIVRKIKVYNDPSRVLKIHSIAVQSPLLKKLLVDVLKNYPGVTAGLQRLEFGGRFEPLIHRWQKLQTAIGDIGDETEEDRTTKSHAELLMDVLTGEFKTLIETSQDMIAKRVMTYELLWTLFQPGATVFTRTDGQEAAMILQESKYGADHKGNPVYWITCKYVDWDGTKFGIQKINHSIPAYSGTRPINQLRVFPIDYHHEADALRTRLTERGAKAEELAGPNYRAYRGIGWKYNSYGTKDKFDVNGRIVIDTYGWNRFNPTYAVFVTPFSQKNKPSLLPPPPGHLLPPPGLMNFHSRLPPPLPPPGCGDDDLGDYDGYTGDDDSGMPMDGHFAAEEEATKQAPLTTEQKLICSPLLRGYSLKTKMWLNFFVNSVHEIEWQEKAFDRLVLPKNQKELILGFTESQRKFRDSFDDVIEGKGRGMIILLCGPPGVGKTLTAESVAEEMKVPLYMMSAGDLGLDPRRVESKLQGILEMCTRWNAVLLLDEADVFLEQRSLHELERNKLVSIFLRVLEYYEGTMFLTTNRVSTFDPAFQSRIHISLDYPELSLESRETVWKNFLESSAQDHTITKSQLKSLTRMNLNGRQIKNILKIARLLASRHDEKLNHEHIITTLEVTQHLHNETQFAERTRGSLYH
ncbi:P-loop containing nucleoside triphosphate hydrolase protein [Sporormia fimetaria CBS 119925]|uniref:P-loop containing nucleoside triphosphate hydrolase protein n=1 Tax=Sporormia fimetaria CBS 119925 TaxID=1340428 RepID=A0A6A6VEW3_9PLEO|nr:P-loop containing nucleoside triphosphate hydrolase protein [Sporormia fimetaria CBS 119925]